MNEALKNIYDRSSVRKFKNEKVPDECIKEILKAGFYAANGMNRQAVRFVVLENKETIKKYNRKAISLFAEMARAAGQPNPMAEKMANDPSADIFYGAPTLVFVFTDPSAVTPVEDGSLTVGNMMLAAHSLGYGTCFIGFAAGLGYDQEFRKEFSVPDDHKYAACMILGKPDGSIEKHPRSEVKILKWVK
ncbi:MAG: nitroreductase [Methanomassiliicoccaceae archaeon]|nr:nitroreductase [Methanomassiliicoccaceae archaeon]MCL2146119.1 nitroreductase [Methanomassiliicoccaceae archaeon]